MRFLHTADWQIGMPARHAGVRAEAVRAERLRTVERIVEVANRDNVDFLVVAGDQFEDAAPAASEITAVVDALQGAAMPVYVLPGNHDPARTDSPYSSKAWARLQGGRVTTVREPSSYAVPGGVLLASPCTKRHSLQDPTDPFAAMASQDGAIRIGLAHGTLKLGSIPEADEGDQRGGYPIALDAASRAGLRYLALGHWHSYLEQSDREGTISYCGTPEPTSYSDHDCGTVSLVEIAGPAAPVRVQRISVAGLAWSEFRFSIGDDADLLRAYERLRELPSPERTLVRAHFRGMLSPRQLEAVGAAQADFAKLFFAYDQRDELEVRPEDGAWLDAFPTGLMHEVAARLTGELSGERAVVAQRALGLLAEIAR